MIEHDNNDRNNPYALKFDFHPDLLRTFSEVRPSFTDFGCKVRTRVILTVLEDGSCRLAAFDLEAFFYFYISAIWTHWPGTSLGIASF